MEEDEGDIFALIKEECDLDDAWLKEMEEKQSGRKQISNCKARI